MTPLTCEEDRISQTATVDEALLNVPDFLESIQQCLGQLKRTASVKRFTTTGDEELAFIKLAGTAPFLGDMLIWGNRPVEVHDVASNFTFGCSVVEVIVDKLGLPLGEFVAGGSRSEVLSDPRLAQFHDEPQRVLSELSKDDAIELARRLEGALSPRADAEEILKDARRTLSEGLSSRF